MDDAGGLSAEARDSADGLMRYRFAVGILTELHPITQVSEGIWSGL